MATVKEKIEKAIEYKNIGNHYFKENKYKKAISKYGIVLAYIRGLPGSKRGLEGIASMASAVNTGDNVTELEDIQSLEIEKVIYQNIANCHIKLKNLQESLEFCNKAIKLP